LKAILIPVGSMGDVHPFIGIGQELKRRGHSVTLFTSGYFEESIRKAGLGFSPSGSKETYLSQIQNKALWDPNKAFEFIVKEVIDSMTRQIYTFISEHYVPQETFVVASTLAIGALVAQEKLGIPTISVHLQPGILRSHYDTSVFHPKLEFVKNAPRWFKKLTYRLSDIYIDRLMGPGLNRFRTELGLTPVRRIFQESIHSPLRVIGTFPEWFAPVQPDWPSQTRLTGFPLFDPGHEESLEARIQEFIDRGEPPVVFTAGSAMTQGAEFFNESIEACKRSGCRGILMTKFKEQLPAILPPHVLHVDYAPFSQIFKKAKAVVHHGGIGTTAQVFQAGVPQIIMPMAHDQPDNAFRVERLGAGIKIRPQDYNAKNVSRLIKKIQQTGYRERAENISKYFKDLNSISLTCDEIERVIR
jgi:rhamnosyltransferase subunit B